ncbi:MAG: hypothetical protein QOH50_5350 [Kribbellaceae bacterium]|nr:hypothetical protein [Kribbellaceae bacterium]
MEMMREHSSVGQTYLCGCHHALNRLNLGPHPRLATYSCRTRDRTETCYPFRNWILSTAVSTSITPQVEERTREPIVIGMPALYFIIHFFANVSV